MGGKARAKQLSADELSAIGKKGANARLTSLGNRERQDIALKAAKARWTKARKLEGK